jgi:hypothetical protein
MAPGRREIGQIDTEVAVAAGAVVAGVSDAQQMRLFMKEATEVMKRAVALGMAIAGTTAAGTRPPAIVTRAEFAEGGREVFNASDPFRRVGEILPRSHDRLLRDVGWACTVKPRERERSRGTHFLCYSVKKGRERVS